MFSVLAHVPPALCALPRLRGGGGEDEGDAGEEGGINSLRTAAAAEEVSSSASATVASESGLGSAADSTVNGTRGQSLSFPGGDQRPPPRRHQGLPLSHPEDREHLTELSCVVREQLEVFVEPPKKKRGKGKGSRNAAAAATAREEHCDDGPYAEGRVGLRCVHCASPSAVEAMAAAGSGKGSGKNRAIVYPKTVSLVYQSVRNYQRHHILNCPSMPREVRDRIVALKTAVWQRRSSNNSGIYWIKSCARMGMVDAEGRGLRLRKEALDGTWTEEMGRAASDLAGAAAAAKTEPMGSADKGGAAGRADSTGERESASKNIGEEANQPLQEMKPKRAGGAGAAEAVPLDVAPDAALAWVSPANEPSSPPKATILADHTRSNSSNEDPVRLSKGCVDPASCLGPSASLTPVRGTALASRNEAEEGNFDDLFNVDCGVAVDFSSEDESSGNDASLPASPQNQALALGSPDLSALESMIENINDGNENCRHNMARIQHNGLASSLEVDQFSLGDPLVPLGPSGSQHDPSLLQNDPSLSLGSDLVNEKPPYKSAVFVAATGDQIVTKQRSQARANEPVRPTVVNSDSAQWGQRQSLSSPTSQSTEIAHAISVVPKEVILERIKLAHSTVQAAGEIRCLSPHISEGSVTGPNEQDLSFLGIELYELFSGRKPFDHAVSLSDGTADEDAIESTFCDPSHSAQRRKRRGRRKDEGEQRKYILLSELGLPSSVCNLVSSLLDAASGTAVEEAYASVDEVLEDLRLMSTDPEKFLFDVDFGHVDDSYHRLHFSPDALYGRNREISQLVDVYSKLILHPEDSIGKSNIVLVSGYSGTGKSAFVCKARDQLVGMGACFISGKFDIMQQMRPLSAMMGALNDYCNQLAQDCGRIDEVRRAVLEAMGGEGRILAELIPNLRLIIDDTPGQRTSSNDPVLVPEAQQRLAFLVRVLLRSTSSRSHPVVLFLDDLQWADEASLELMHSLVADTQLDALLLVGCYRDNEVGPDHPLMKHLEDIRLSCRITTTSICVRNLDTDTVNDLLSDLLGLFPRKTRPLAEVVLQKTGGNALFVVQFLASVCDEGLLRFSLTSRRWEWDIDRIQRLDVQDTVVDFVTAKLLRLAPDIHEALKIGAAFGVQTDANLLTILDRDPCRLVCTDVALDVAVSEGLMAKVDGPAYRFSHDQIHSAAYLLIPESDRKAFHLQIGRTLWRHATEDELESYLFVVVDQLHRGAQLISDHDEKVQLARLSLQAGKKAFAMSAFLPASAYLNAGISLITSNDWEVHARRGLCFDLYNSCAETEYVLGHFDATNQHLQEIIHRAKSMEESLRAHYTLVQAMIAQGRLMDAINTALTVLSTLGEEFASPLSEDLRKKEMFATHALLGKKTEEELLNLKPMENHEKRQAVKFLASILNPARTQNRLLMNRLACRIVSLSLQHGVCPESAMGFVYYGGIRGAFFGDFNVARRLGQFALSIVEKFEARECLARVHLPMYTSISGWSEPLQSSSPPLKNAINVGLATGDIEHAMLAAQGYTITSLASGCPLASLYEETKMYSKQMVEYKRQHIEILNRPTRQAMLNLMGHSTDPVKLVGEVMDENRMLQYAENVEDSILKPNIYAYRLWLEYLFGRYELAVETASKNQDLPRHFSALFVHVCNFTFYSGLAALALARKSGGVSYLGTIEKTMTQMKDWATAIPWNCQHKLELMKAEYAYLSGGFFEAAQGYDLAAELAAKHRFVHEEALALERAGIFYLETGDHDNASTFLVRAIDCYKRWGAHGKVAHIRESYL